MVSHIHITDSLLHQYKKDCRGIYFYFLTNESKKICLNDKITFISKVGTDKLYINTKVVDVKEYKNINEATNENKDFLSDSNGNSFYTPEDIADGFTDNYISVLVIFFEEDNITLSKTNVLIDDNALLGGENEDNDIDNLFKWCQAEDCHMYITNEEGKRLNEPAHANINNDIAYDVNSFLLTQDINKTENDPLFSNLIRAFINTDSFAYKCKLLKLIFDGVMDILVTDDEIILDMARNLYIKDRVFLPSELIEKFENDYPKQVDYDILSVRLKKFNDLVPYYDSPFFESLISDYSDFGSWFNKKVKDNTDVYIYALGDKLKGMLYLKIEDRNENYDDILPKFQPKKRLKIGTFKTTGTGIKLGERFLKITFDNAIQADVDEIYVTLFKDRNEDLQYLYEFFTEWGFTNWGRKRTGETVLVKDMKNYDLSKRVKENYPLVKPNPQYFFLPIKAAYHTQLFPDCILKTEDKYEYSDDKPHKYAIEKYYISNAYKFNGATRGDIMLIYRMAPDNVIPKKYKSCVTGQVIVEDSTIVYSAQECLDKCHGRSIYSDEEIKNLSYPATILHLLLLDSFPRKVPLYEIRENRGIIQLQHGPRQFDKIGEEDYNTIVELGNGKKY